jgi:hypothetical protein
MTSRRVGARRFKTVFSLLSLSPSLARAAQGRARFEGLSQGAAQESHQQRRLDSTPGTPSPFTQPTHPHPHAPSPTHTTHSSIPQPNRSLSPTLQLLPRSLPAGFSSCSHSFRSPPRPQPFPAPLPEHARARHPLPRHYPHHRHQPTFPLPYYRGFRHHRRHLHHPSRSCQMFRRRWGLHPAVASRWWRGRQPRGAGDCRVWLAWLAPPCCSAGCRLLPRRTSSNHR